MPAINRYQFLAHRRPIHRLVMGDGSGNRRLPETDLIVSRVAETGGLAFAFLPVSETSTPGTADDAYLPPEGETLWARSVDDRPPACYRVFGDFVRIGCPMLVDWLYTNDAYGTLLRRIVGINPATGLALPMGDPGFKPDFMAGVGGYAFASRISASSPNLSFYSAATGWVAVTMPSISSDPLNTVAMGVANGKATIVSNIDASNVGVWTVAPPATTMTLVATIPVTTNRFVQWAAFKSKLDPTIVFSTFNSVSTYHIYRFDGAAGALTTQPAAFSTRPHVIYGATGTLYYLGAGVIWSSLDDGDSWTQVGSNYGESDSPLNSLYRAVAIDDGIYYVDGTNFPDGQIGLFHYGTAGNARSLLKRSLGADDQKLFTTSLAEEVNGVAVSGGFVYFATADDTGQAYTVPKGVHRWDGSSFATIWASPNNGTIGLWSGEGVS